MAITDIMRLPSADREGRKAERFNYIGMHRYLITQPLHPGAEAIADPAHVFAYLNALRDVSNDHHFDVYAYCFLPRQLVLIVRGREETSSMKGFLSAFRQSSATVAEGFGVPHLWSRRYTERVLRKSEDSRSAAKDVFMMPVRLGLVPSAGAYPFLGSFVVSTGAVLAPSGGERHTSHSPKVPPTERRFSKGRRVDVRKVGGGRPKERKNQGRKPGNGKRPSNDRRH